MEKRLELLKCTKGTQTAETQPCTENTVLDGAGLCGAGKGENGLEDVGKMANCIQLLHERHC